MKRFVSLLAIACGLALPMLAGAQAVSDHSQWGWHPLVMRTTQAATGSVVQELNWAKNDHGMGTTVGFADSIVIRKAATTRTLVDTSAAYRIEEFAFPPSYAYRGGQAGGRAQKLSAMQALPGGTDSVTVDTTDASPWLAIRVVPDSLSGSFTGSSGGGDSVLVGAQISYDGGYTWQSVNGTPTRAFLADATAIYGGDGLAVPMLTGAEASPSTEVEEVVLECQPSIFKAGNTFIINRTLCMSGAMVRFIIGLCDATGQYQPQIGYWSPLKD